MKPRSFLLRIFPYLVEGREARASSGVSASLTSPSSSNAGRWSSVLIVANDDAAAIALRKMLPSLGSISANGVDS